MPLLLHEVLLNDLAKRLQLAERLVLSHVVLEVRPQIHFEEIAEVGDMIAGACAHFRQPCIKLMQPVNSDHVIHIS